MFSLGQGPRSGPRPVQSKKTLPRGPEGRPRRCAPAARTPLTSHLHQGAEKPIRRQPSTVWGGGHLRGTPPLDCVTGYHVMGLLSFQWCGCHAWVVSSHITSAWSTASCLDTLENTRTGSWPRHPADACRIPMTCRRSSISTRMLRFYSLPTPIKVCTLTLCFVFLKLFKVINWFSELQQWLFILFIYSNFVTPEFIYLPIHFPVQGHSEPRAYPRNYRAGSDYRIFLKWGHRRDLN